MKHLIVGIVALAAFIGTFIGANALINLIISGIQDNDIRGIAKVVLWVLGVSLVLMIGIAAGAFAGAFTESAIDRLAAKKRRKNYLKKIK